MRAIDMPAIDGALVLAEVPTIAEGSAITELSTACVRSHR